MNAAATTRSLPACAQRAAPVRAFGRTNLLVAAPRAAGAVVRAAAVESELIFGFNEAGEFTQLDGAKAASKAASSTPQASTAAPVGKSSRKGKGKKAKNAPAAAAAAAPAPAPAAAADPVAEVPSTQEAVAEAEAWIASWRSQSQAAAPAASSETTGDVAAAEAWIKNYRDKNQ